MSKLSAELLTDLLITSAMEAYAESNKTMDLTDVIDHVFADEAGYKDLNISRESYLRNLQKLTELKYINSNLLDYEDEEDEFVSVNWTELAEYRIEGLTPEGKQYVKRLEKQDDIKLFLTKICKCCGAVSNNEIFQLIKDLSEIVCAICRLLH